MKFIEQTLILYLDLVNKTRGYKSSALWQKKTHVFLGKHIDPRVPRPSCSPVLRVGIFLVSVRNSIKQGHEMVVYMRVRTVHMAEYRKLRHKKKTCCFGVKGGDSKFLQVYIHFSLVNCLCLSHTRHLNKRYRTSLQRIRLKEVWKTCWTPSSRKSWNMSNHAGIWDQQSSFPFWTCTRLPASLLECESVQES